MSFKEVTGGEQGVIYAVTDSGDLLFFRDPAQDGTGSLAFGGVGQKIGDGWASFVHAFSGGNGIIYAVAQNGDLLFFRDQARDGTASWAFGGVGQKIGDGWANFTHIFSGGNGIIYAVAQNGDLLFFRDQAQDGTASLAFGGVGQKIGDGWGNFVQLFSGGNGIIYGVAQNGDLLFFRDQAQDGTASWAFGGVGQKIGGDWQNFVEILSGGNGVLYTVTPDGFLLFFRDQAQDGTASWAYDGAGQTIGSGWSIDRGHPKTIEGYCAPLSVAPGGAVEFMISAQNDYSVTYLRLKRQADGSIGVPMLDRVDLKGATQPIPPEAWRTGCGWAKTLTLQVPPEWQSGMYAAHCADAQGGEFYIVFVVTPGTQPRRDFAVLASTNTWNAYNEWGGRSKYTSPPAALLSFARPNPETSPVDDGQLNHTTRAELWLHNWMEDEGYRVDVYADHDFHAGIDGLATYKALILNTHPEYWTQGMLDNLEAFIHGGGTVLYLGGNGVFEEVVYDATAGALTLLRGDPGSDRALSYFRNLDPARSERALLGVGYRADSFMTFAPYHVTSAGHRFFAGTGLANADLIGENGINGGAASGWEVDTSIAGTAPDGSVVHVAGQADDRGTPPANLELLARGDNPACGADMTYYDTGGGGFVFSVGSLSFVGSLVQDANLQTIVRNALNECVAR
jgi:N,N-dimethylformamidase